MDTMRLDAFLVSQGFVSGREKAKELIGAGAVTVNDRQIYKASLHVSTSDEVECDTSSIRFVGRGGLKLEKALQMSGLDVDELIALDVGASTGGFTDCLLQAGARHVYAVDVGSDQLHPDLRADARVTVLENTDIRSEAASTAIPMGGIDVCAIDVSFISLQQILPSVLPFLKSGATVLALIKPQFEAGKAALGKRGVVRDKKVQCTVLQTLCGYFAAQNLQITALSHSPITGGEGNIEFLVVLVYSNTKAVSVAPIDVREIVDKAHEMLKKGAEKL